METKERDKQYYIDIIDAMAERTIKRLWVTILLLIVLLAGSWIGFFAYESQWEDVSASQEVDTGDGNAYVAGVGDVNYGEGQANGKDPFP